MIAVSPWTRGGWVDSHVSRPHLGAALPGDAGPRALGKPATCPNISAWRRTVCGDLTGMFDFAHPVYGLPVAARHHRRDRRVELHPAAQPRARGQPVAAAGARHPPGPRAAVPAERLPDALHHRLRRPDPRLDLDGQPGRGRHRLDAPGRVRQRLPHAAARGSTRSTRAAPPATSSTAAPGYGNGPYDLSVVGPNRFVRRFQGDATKPGKDLTVTSVLRRRPRHRQAGRLLRVRQLRLRRRSRSPSRPPTTAPTAPGRTPCSRARAPRTTSTP